MSIVDISGSVDISLDLGSRLQTDLADLSPATVQAIRPILQELVRQWREELIAVWPVATGRSQSSWVNRWEGLRWVLQNPVEYAEFVHNEGDGTEVWTYLEALSESLLEEVLPSIEKLIAADRLQKIRRGGRTRSLLGFAARSLASRVASQRLFVAAATRFAVVSSRTRNVKQRARSRAGEPRR